ncbi:hypothetical protein UJ101_02530 [Flavobacteriaceae bacterium UJ101]|nr:hypothetical protein UJ101_02530 [Flavobacteriaceae bacterium UJ101]
MKKRLLFIMLIVGSCIYAQDGSNQVLVADGTSQGSSNGVTTVDQQVDNNKNDATDGSNEYRTDLYTDKNIEPGAQLEIDSTDKAFLITRVETSSIDTASEGTTTSGMITYDPVTKGFYFKNDSGWVSF